MITMKPWSEMSAAERDTLVGRTLFDMEPVEIGEYLFYTTSDSDDILDNDYPQFTTSISAAWQVVEKMKDLGWNMDLNNALVWYGEKQHWHHVQFANGQHQIVGQARTASEAICNGALKALRVAGVGGVAHVRIRLVCLWSISHIPRIRSIRVGTLQGSRRCR